MKYIFIIAIALSVTGFFSCDDQKMDWYRAHDEIVESEIPLQLAEKISRYAALNTYTDKDFTLGVGIDLDIYMKDETYRTAVHTNFDEITVGYHMKHGAMVSASGEISYAKADALMDKVKEAGLTVYGHTLVWHQNQNATYLNSLLVPIDVPDPEDPENPEDPEDPGNPEDPEEPSSSNLIDDGDFESDLGSWDIPNYSGNVTVSTDDAVTGTSSMKVQVGDFGGGKYNMQVNSPLFPIINGHKYEISFSIKSDVAGQVGIDFPNDNLTNQYPWTGGQELVTTTTAWQQVSYNPTTTPDGMVATADNNEMKFRLLLGAVQNVTYYIDNVAVIDLDAIPADDTPPADDAILAASLRATQEVDTIAVITRAMEDWISAMMEHYKDVNAWDVVNEPMDDGKPSNLKTGIGKTLASDEFYWQDYLGKNYAVTAFKLARQYGKSGAKLFINDYNLENSAKCEELIDYVKYDIERIGETTVDGIGTQMHISITTDKDAIATMFDKLGRTGKLIKISELDIKTGTASPTADLLAQQAEMYRYVVEMYMKYVPKAQRYGITVWCISDHPDEHINWIPDDAPNLWDKDYKRKHAYKGFADGLADRDISEDEDFHDLPEQEE